MASAFDVASDIAAAGGAVSGLILVYIGALTNSFGAYQPQEKKSVLASYQRRAWFAFIGLLLFLASVTLAILGKWIGISALVVSAMTLLLLGFIWVAATAALSVLEIK